MFHHRRSLFPLLLALLTLVLVIFMFYAFTGRSLKRSNVVGEPSPVSAQQYQTELHELTSTFVEQYEGEANDLARLVLVETTLQKLLSLRVPTEQKDRHLALAVELNQMQQALRQQNGEADVAFERFKVYVAN